jgi:hypothetical protein
VGETPSNNTLVCYAAHNKVKLNNNGAVNMRKIEQQMVKAIRDKRNWKSGNTAVVHVRDIKHGINYADIYLHGNHIATATPDTCDTYPHANPNRVTFRDWPTATTRSRLCALGVNASIKNGAACIDGMEV